MGPWLQPREVCLQAGCCFDGSEHAKVKCYHAPVRRQRRRLQCGADNVTEEVCRAEGCDWWPLPQGVPGPSCFRNLEKQKMNFRFSKALRRGNFLERASSNDVAT